MAEKQRFMAKHTQHQEANSIIRVASEMEKWRY
jgi:hypothetical protein